MNPDLKFRLTPYPERSGADDLFFCNIAHYLCEEALLGVGGVYEIRLHFHAIENDDDDTGYVIYSGETFHVHLDNRMPIGMVIDYLIHELAHVHSWHVADEHEDHCDEFGKSYALLYREYLKLYEEFA